MQTRRFGITGTFREARIRALIEQEGNLRRTFRIRVAFGLGPERTLTIVAEDAMEAVITGMCELGLTTLSGVSGIIISEL